MKHKHKLAYMMAAYGFSTCSNANRLKVGAVLVKDNNIISTGYNGMPEHISDPMETEDNVTDERVRHAEENCLNKLRKLTISSVGSSMFCTHWCCLNCAIEVVDSGVKDFYYCEEYRTSEGLDYLKKHINVIRLEKQEVFNVLRSIPSLL